MSTYPIWGWGGPDEEPRNLASAGPTVAATLGFPVQSPERPAALPDLPVPRVVLPAALHGLASTEARDRARHALGRSYRDVVRGIRAQFDHLPDLVVRPTTEGDVAAVIDWAGSNEVAVIPFGGGTSVVGGVEPDVGPGFRGCISLDLERLSGVLDVDTASQAALVWAGTTGPDFDRELGRHGFTARFYPQSYQRSTVGGWLATRAAGHFATRLQHIDDLVESIRAITPSGPWESRRLPGSGAGPSPDRLMLGSEGTLGVITQAWIRVQPRPTHRARTVLRATSFATGVEALRQLMQAGLAPAGSRLVDGAEYALTSGEPAMKTSGAVLVLAAEAVGRPVDGELAAAVAACRDLGLTDEGAATPPGTVEATGWREGFQRAPLLREVLVLLGVLTETFETAVTWERLLPLIDAVRSATTAALDEACGGGRVTCRLTHAYPDGAAAYFTVLAPARRGSELSQWRDVKSEATEALLAAGGTVTHHHAVGRDHRDAYGQQSPPRFAAALTAVKGVLDPAGILNPGVLLPPSR